MHTQPLSQGCAYVLSKQRCTLLVNASALSSCIHEERAQMPMAREPPRDDSGTVDVLVKFDFVGETLGAAWWLTVATAMTRVLTATWRTSTPPAPPFDPPACFCGGLEASCPPPPSSSLSSICKRRQQRHCPHQN